MTKKCFKCNRMLSLSKFYEHPETKDGYFGKCKECTKADNTKNREKNVEYYREYDKQRSKEPHRVALKRKQYIEFRKKHPEKYKAHRAVSNAVRDGRLTKQPCKCKEIKVIGHHEDYSKPLEVIWMCRKCHYQLHRKEKNGNQKRVT